MGDHIAQPGGLQKQGQQDFRVVESIDPCHHPRRRQNQASD